MDSSESLASRDMPRRRVALSHDLVRRSVLFGCCSVGFGSARHTSSRFSMRARARCASTTARVARTSVRRARVGSRVVVVVARASDASSGRGLVLPGDDAFERLRARASSDGDDDDDEDARENVARDVANVDAAPGRGRSLHARWSVLARFGRKAAAREALKTWARTIGAAAGVSSERFSICSGYVGGRESALEMVVSGFGSVGEVETFLTSVPRDAHVAWGREFAEYVVDGSPEWVVVEVSGVSDNRVGGGVDGVRAAVPSARAASAPTRSPAAPAAYEELDESQLIPGTTLPDGRTVVTDWKGDPMVINPGDKMPRF